MNLRTNNPSTEHTTRPKALEDQEEWMPESTSHLNPSTSSVGEPAVQLKAPFPRRLLKKNYEQQFKSFLELLRNLHIDIPLVEALEQMECDAFVNNKLPKKQKDPGSFIVSCSIGGLDVGHALCDLGANINLMPLSIFKKLGIGEAQPTSVMLQLVDRTITYPKGKIKDVLVKVEKFIFLVDFIILDYEADMDVPIILECPLLATGKVLIDVHKEELTMRMLQKQIRAIGWTLVDIRGINPSYCMHKIRLEEGKTRSYEPQHRLNPIMEEVVKKEIIKWLDA
ncbi:uncharacterized protein LOC120090613 [Benincasa hispida]|uniref:uncharacterized protein LOC120090613 n=1 Tax=Benincasa hispida TaxID=102211 RepID=UPI0019022667|nr:uncharacterized protein LOC120090613 [Benincasa hispida]